MWKTLLRFCEWLKWVHVSGVLYWTLSNHPQLAAATTGCIGNCAGTPASWTAGGRGGLPELSMGFTCVMLQVLIECLFNRRATAVGISVWHVGCMLALAEIRLLATLHQPCTGYYPDAIVILRWVELHGGSQQILPPLIRLYYVLSLSRPSAWPPIYSN